MTRLLIFAVAALAAFVTPAGAETYWVAYEGNDFPENEGWERIYGDEHGPGHGGAERWIEDGALVIDSLRHDQIDDFYLMERWIDPDPGDVFTAEWRLLVEETSDDFDVSVAIVRSFEPGYIGIEFGPDSLRIFREGFSVDFDPGVYHIYRVESTNMIDYRLLIDGQLVHEGLFATPASDQSFVAFGDGVIGRRSFSRWDYFRFGAVPEPSTLLLISLMLTTWRMRCRRGSQTRNVTC